MRAGGAGTRPGEAERLLDLVTGCVSMLITVHQVGASACMRHRGWLVVRLPRRQRQRP